jgi:hypothetical protein
MKNLLDEILNRAHKKENEERYHQLINHTSDIPDGERFIRQTERAKEILKISPITDQLDNEYRLIIRHLTQWLDKNNWA